MVSIAAVLALSACGGGGSSSSASAPSYGSGNSRPSVNLAASIEVDENQTDVVTVGASDADGDQLSFSLSGDDASAFNIDSDGVLTFTTAPDFETKSSYSITVEVSDGSETESQAVSIQILDVAEEQTNRAPAISGLDATVEVNENQSRLLTLDASDADGDTLSYTLEGVDADAFEVSEDGVINFVNAPDYETKTSYQLTVVVSDGVDTTRQDVAVQIRDVAEATAEAPVEFNIVVARGTNGYGTGNKYSINDNISPNLELQEGKTYRFLQSDGTNATHPLYLSTTANGTFGGGVAFTEGVSRVNSTGSAGAYVQFTVPSGVTTLYYYCGNHSGMGGTITVSAAASGVYIVPMN
ncbi:MAG: cadherin domain-containing protein [Pseudomonadota bacterium]|nr:cadherin domain-containing protein [Pseudomonadota bacterium]